MLRPVQPETLDHVALWVPHRDRIADFVTTKAGMHVIDRTDAFTLVGTDARRGKLTLFAAEGPREAGPLARIGLRASALPDPLAQLPEGREVDRPHRGEARLELSEGLGIALVEAPTD